MHAILPALAFVFALSAAPAVAEESAPVSEAETLLFLGDQLKDVAPGTTLRYKFARTANLEKEKSFSDTVEVSVSGTPKSKKVATRCLPSSGQKSELPPVEGGAEGNPALLCFLEREIKEMERLTGGKAFHFRQQIRRTLADNAAIRDVNVELEGKQIGAKQVQISPYLDDIFRARFEKYASKSYVFILSDGVPGRLYRIETVIPDQAGADRPPLVQEILSYSGATGGGAKKK